MADEIQEVIRIVTKDLKKLDALIEKNGALKDSAGKASKKTSELGSAVGTLTTAAVGFLSIGFAKQIAQQARELGELGAKAQFVSKSFQTLGNKFGKSYGDMSTKMKDATQGMISEMELQQLAMQSMVSGVSFDDMIVAMEFVSRQALATGADVSQKMQTVMTGFARGSAMFLDDVGIQVMGAKDVVGAAVDQMKEKMDLFEDATGTSFGNIEKTNTEIQNLKAQIGEGLVPVTETWAKLTLDAYKNISNLVDKIIKQNKAIDPSDVVANRKKENLELANKLNSMRMSSKEIKTQTDELWKLWKVQSGIKEFIKTEQWQRGQLRGLAIDILDTQKLSSEEWDKQTDIISSLGPQLVAQNVDFETRKELILQMMLAYKKYNAELVKPTSKGKGLTDEQIIAQMRIDAQKKIEEELWQWRINLANKEAIRKYNIIKSNDEAYRQAESQRIVAFNDQVIADAERMEQLIGEIKGGQRQKDIAAELEKRQMFMNSANMMVSGINKLSSSKQMALQKEAQAEIKAIQMSTKSEKQKAKEISKVNKQLEDDQKKAANVAWAATSALGAAKASLAIIDMIQRFPSFTPAGKIAAGAVIGGVAFSQVANIVASKPKFYNGGDVPFNGRNDDSQIALVRSGEKILNPVEARRYNAGVTNNTNNNGNTYNISVSVQGGGSNQELTAMLTTALPEVLERGVKTGDIDLGRMGIVTV